MKKLKRWGLVLLIVVGVPLAPALTFGAYFGFLQLTGNFHAVQDGVVYRAAQPDAARIAEYKTRYNIQSILNLRGDNTGSPWYDNEVAAARAHGITHLNFRMSARRELTQEQGAALIAMLRDAPKPLLIHCNSGADRTGLASELYLAAVLKKSEGEVEDQLSFGFGHIPIPYLSSAYAMERTFENLEKSLGFGGS